jgi:putative copper resistance protein D
VSTLALTGIANAWFTVGSLPAMLGTDYGRLLSLKLLLFTAMLGVAAMNKFRYTPQLWQSARRSRRATSCGALRRLGRNAGVEIVLGIAVLCIVGALGAGTPGAHQQTLWPFAYTLGREAAREHAQAIALCPAAAAAAVILAAGARRRRHLAIACVAGGSIIAASFLLWLLAVPANPTTYFRSPVRYSAQSIGDGVQAYAEQCSICHGAQGRGDGPAAAALPVRPTDLTEHVLHHREGDILWWIKRGIPGTPMPAFEGRIAEPRMWDVINLLRARAEAGEARSMGDAVQSEAAKAPDFNFQIDREGPESLADERSRHNVLFVLFDPSESSGRLRALLQAQGELKHADLRIIAMPTRGSTSVDRQQATEPAISAHFEPRVVSAYTIFAPRSGERQGGSELTHAEFLIDRQGYIRARWTPGDDPKWLQVPYLIAQVRAAEREKPRSLVSDEGEHAHH